jgi:hypothetical protein
MMQGYPQQALIYVACSSSLKAQQQAAATAIQAAIKFAQPQA